MGDFLGLREEPSPQRTTGVRGFSELLRPQFKPPCVPLGSQAPPRAPESSTAELLHCTRPLPAHLADEETEASQRGKGTHPGRMDNAGVKVGVQVRLTWKPRFKKASAWRWSPAERVPPTEYPHPARPWQALAECLLWARHRGA